ncbi:hypothetical protein [Hydrogenophaga sp. NH-16]|uniref:hypothetical protein n=1 Tax=Hydrogenophaga sp. NH-16 TaxID=2184519 RepID=UPI0019D4A86E|nr:hypothetical protein [Hydrogenophaga sp. NH-16]
MFLPGDEFFEMVSLSAGCVVLIKKDSFDFLKIAKNSSHSISLKPSSSSPEVDAENPVATASSNTLGRPSFGTFRPNP